jgi:hypothetical protein
MWLYLSALLVLLGAVMVVCARDARHLVGGGQRSQPERPAIEERPDPC